MAVAKQVSGCENELVEEDLQLNEYRNFLEEIEKTVIKFATQTRNEALLMKVQDIYADVTLDTSAALNKILTELKSVSLN